MRNQSFVLVAAAALAISACGPRNADKLDDDELAGAEGGAIAEADTRCESRTAQDEIKRQLFARAAEIRGGNGDDYARIAEFAVFQVDGAAPVVATSAGGLVDCRGRGTLRLPAGLRVAGGRTTLGGDIGYSVGAGARGVVTLGQSDAIAIPLATLTQARAGAPSSAPSRPPVDGPAGSAAPEPASRPTPAPIERPRPRPQPAPPPEVSTGSARPSFNCRSARTAGERAVCDSPALAALDRDMAAQYRSAVANGAPQDRRLLAQTRDRFLTYRDRCRDDACVANTYRGRMREIDDIVAGRWRGER